MWVFYDWLCVWEIKFSIDWLIDCFKMGMSGQFFIRSFLAIWASCAHQSNSTPSPRPNMVPEPYNLHPNGRNFAIWRAVRGALLPDERHLVEAVLLPVWIPVFGVYHPYYFRLNHQHCDGILPAMRRGKKSIVIFKAEMIGRSIVWLIVRVNNWLIDWLMKVSTGYSNVSG